jgi:hypothetical protein
LSRHRDDAAADQGDFRIVLWVKRFEDDDFVALVQPGHEGGKASLRQAVRDKYFLRRELQTIMPGQLFGQRLAQRQRALQVAVVHDAIIQRLFRGGLDMRRRVH